MVYVREDNSEDVTDYREETRDGNRGVVVETDGGYFEYWIPVTDAPDYVDRDEVLDMFHMTIVEAPGEPNESRFDGSSELTVPEKVVKKAEEVTGVERLE